MKEGKREEDIKKEKEMRSTNKTDKETSRKK
jgi:hypothetical protein